MAENTELKQYIDLEGLAAFKEQADGHYVAQEAGKSLSTNDLTDELKAKIEAAAAADDLDALEALVGELPEGATAATIVEYIDKKTADIASGEAMTQLTDRVTQAEADIDAAEAGIAELTERIEAEVSRASTVEIGLANDIEEVSVKVGTIPEGSEATDLVGYVDEKAAAVQGAVDAEAARAKDIEESLEWNINDTKGRVSAIEGDYLKAADIADMATDQELADAVAGIEAKGYQNAAQVEAAVTAGTTGMATQTWVGEQGYETAANVDSKIAAAISAVYKPQGSAAFASLPALSADVEGFVYNVTDAFVTDESFVEGAGASYPAGTNVVCVEVDGGFKWDVLTGMYDLTPYAKTEDLGVFAKSEDITAVPVASIQALWA